MPDIKAAIEALRLDIEVVKLHNRFQDMGDYKAACKRVDAALLALLERAGEQGGWIDLEEQRELARLVQDRRCSAELIFIRLRNRFAALHHPPADGEK